LKTIVCSLPFSDRDLLPRLPALRREIDQASFAAGKDENFLLMELSTSRE